jgi:PAS domain S-box-containing protein
LELGDLLSERPLNSAEIQKDHAIVHFFAVLAGVEEIDVRARLMVSGIAFFLRLDAVVLGFRGAGTSTCIVHTWKEGANAEFKEGPETLGSVEECVSRVVQQFGYPFSKTLALVYQGKVIGYLAVARREPPRLASEEEFLLGSFQTLSALLLANYRSVIELKQQSTRLQAALESLHRQDTQLRTILDSLPVGVFFVDVAGKIVLGNPMAERIWAGLKYVELPEYAVYKAWWPASGKRIESHEWAAARALATGEAVLNEEVQIESFDGTRKTIMNSAVPIRDEGGATVGAVVINQDVTERQRAQQSLMRAEKLASAGRLAASIAHEINNPLEAVTNLVFLALNDAALSLQTREFLGMAEQELGRVSHITKTALGFYRDSAAPAEVEITALLDEVLALYARKLEASSIQVDRSYVSGATAWANAGEMRQLFSNLISNAIDALPNGGKLALRVRRSRQWKDLSTAGLRITVADNGPGIEREHLQSIFEAFFTTKKAVGTGLGLWLSKNIVDKHGGAIRVRSTAGAGTMFSIFLPLRTPKALSIKASAGA